MVNLRGCPGCQGGGYTRTKVHYARIMEAFTDRGILGPDILSLARETEDMARKYSPVRSGRMKALHYRVVMPARGYERDFFVGTKAGYGRFVRGGTAGDGTGYITGKTGPMELRPAPYSYFGVNDPRRFQDRVKGQKSNDWLGRALRDAVRYRMQTGRRA